MTEPMTRPDTGWAISEPGTDSSISRLRDAINSHDPARVADAHTVDFRCTMPMHPSRSFTGNARVLENWTRFLTRVPDLHAEIIRSVHDAGTGETWSEWEMTGSTGDATPVSFRGTVISAAREGKIAWNRFYLDEVLDPSFEALSAEAPSPER